MEEGIRINKALADAGFCSRRKADELVAAGLVRVNGEVVTSPGLRVHPGVDTLEVNGKKAAGKPAEPCYLLLHKPIRVVSTASDPEGRTTVLDLIPEQWKHRRLYPAGRLDFFSEGLVLITDDGDLTNRLVHPRHHLPRIYHVLVREDVPESTLKTLRTGMVLAEGEQLAPVDVRILPGKIHDITARWRDAGERTPPAPSNDRQKKTPRQNGPSGQPAPSGQAGTLLELTLHQGVNRQIRRMCRDLGLTVLRLVRVAQGPLQLGDLPPGEVRSLTSAEKDSLKRALGLL